MDLDLIRRVMIAIQQTKICDRKTLNGYQYHGQWTYKACRCAIGCDECAKKIAIEVLRVAGIPEVAISSAEYPFNHI